jgi:hypothetical protein
VLDVPRTPLDHPALDRRPFTVHDAAQALSCDVSSVLFLVRQGKLETSRIGRLVCVSIPSLQAFWISGQTPPIDNNAVIYFILAEEISRIKIGFSLRVRDRFRELELQNAATLKLAAVVSGTQRAEALLHARFAEFRLHGEWFRYEGALKEYVEAL